MKGFFIVGLFFVLAWRASLIYTQDLASAALLALAGVTLLALWAQEGLRR